jgi:type IV secretion system protein VirD4
VEGVNESSFWQASAEMMLAPLLLASAHEGGMRALITWLDAGTDADNDVADAIDQVGDELAASAWQAVRQMEPRTRSSVTATARTVLGAWWDPAVLELARPELTPQRLLEGAGSLFMVAPTHDQERLRSIFAGIVSEMTRAVYQHRARTGRRLDPGLLVVLDEAAHIAPVRNLPELAATGPEPGIQLVSIFHDAAQITAAYGRRAPTVVANHRARLYLPGIGDPDTLAHLSRALGDTHVARRQTTRGPAGASITTAEHQRPLIPAHELREMHDGQALLVYGTRPPARIQLRPWYRDRRLQALARGQR